MIGQEQTETPAGVVRVGDRIKFRSATRDGCRAAVRKVVGIDEFGRPLVAYHGWSHFVVLHREVLEVLA